MKNGKNKQNSKKDLVRQGSVLHYFSSLLRKEKGACGAFGAAGAEENQERKYNNTTTNHKTTDRINTGTNISPANLQKSQHTAKPWQPSWTTNIHKSMKTSERPHVHQTGNVLMAKASRTICGGKNSRTTWIRFGNQNSRTP